MGPYLKCKCESSFVIFLQTLCQPCNIHYDFIGSLETLQADLKQILPRIGAEDFRDEFPRQNVGSEGANKYMEMYRNVPMDVLRPILDKFQVDADMFNYSYVGYHDSLT